MNKEALKKEITSVPGAILLAMALILMVSIAVNFSVIFKTIQKPYDRPMPKIVSFQVELENSAIVLKPEGELPANIKTVEVFEAFSTGQSLTSSELEKLESMLSKRHAVVKIYPVRRENTQDKKLSELLFELAYQKQASVFWAVRTGISDDMKGINPDKITPETLLAAGMSNEIVAEMNDKTLGADYKRFEGENYDMLKTKNIDPRKLPSVIFDGKNVTSVHDIPLG